MSDTSEKKRKSSDHVEQKQKFVLFILNFYPHDHHSKDTHYAVFASGADVETFDKICERIREDMSKVYDSPWHEELIDSTHTWFPFVEFFCLKESSENTRRSLASHLMLPIGKMTKELWDSEDCGKDFRAENIGTLQITSSATELMSFCTKNKIDSVIAVHPHCNKEKLHFYEKNKVQKLEL